ncbi:MAG: hypothetical protein AAF602_07655 [Myxococcota bacterium]
MEPLRRHFTALDHTAWTGLIVLSVGILGGMVAIVSRLMPESWAIDISAMGAYASIFMLVGIVLYLRGDG